VRRDEGKNRINLTTIPLNHIFHLAKLFRKERPSRKLEKGRPLTYPEFLVTPFAIKQVCGLSYRQIPSFCQGKFGKYPSPFNLALPIQEDKARKVEGVFKMACKRGGFMKGKGTLQS